MSVILIHRMKLVWELIVSLYLLDRIEDAQWHLRKFAKMDKAEKQGKTARSKVSENENDVDINRAPSSDDKTKQTLRNCSSEDDLFDIVSFRQENFVQSRHSQEKLYDTIIW